MNRSSHISTIMGSGDTIVFPDGSRIKFISEKNGRVRVDIKSPVAWGVDRSNNHPAKKPR